MPLIKSSLTLQANLFHEFHPIGGVSARFADGGVASCATRPVTKSERQKDNARARRSVFMPTFYQKCPLLESPTGGITWVGSHTVHRWSHFHPNQEI